MKCVLPPTVLANLLKARLVERMFSCFLSSYDVYITLLNDIYITLVYIAQCQVNTREPT